METNAAAEFDEELTAEVDAMVKKKQLLFAVKLVRDKLGWDLRSARDAVYARRTVLGMDPPLELKEGSDLTKFEEFFKKMGVRGAFDVLDIEVPWVWPKEAKHVITVSQAHFCFDGHGRYIGVVADEMGDFDERIVP